MFRKDFLFIAVCWAVFSAGVCRAEILSVDEGAAYKTISISEAEYNADTSGQVFKEYSLSEDGELTAKYYRYEVVDKEYAEVITKSGSGEDNGVIADINVGLGVKNEGTLSGISDTLYSGNKYEFTYTGDIADDFVRGGAVYNSGTIGVQDTDGNFIGTAIEADFIGNEMVAEIDTEGGVHVEGAALANQGRIGVVKGDFINNAVEGRYVEGAAVYNSSDGYIEGFQGDFVGNRAVGEQVKGAGVFNTGRIGEIEGNFVANTIEAAVQANGGVIQNNDKDAVIDSINGNFVGNKATSGLQAWGGSIDNAKGVIGKISGVFNNNQAIGDASLSKFTYSVYGLGGAISNQGIIGEIEGLFVGNLAEGDFAYGGAIYSETEIGQISGDFIGNTANGKSVAQGGAIYHEKSVLYLKNSNFYNNAVVSDRTAMGGAVYANKLLVEADGANSVFQGNTANGKSNAVYIEGKTSDNGLLELSSLNNGKIIFDDDIDGNDYNISLTGDGSGETVFNGLVDNVNNFVLNDGALAHLGSKAEVNTVNYTADGDNSLMLDIEVDRANNTINNGIINVSGDVSGHTSVIVNSLNSDRLNDIKDAYTVFLSAPNDLEDTDSDFTVSRVISSPYMWNSLRNYQGETEGSTWYLVASEGYAPEIPAYLAMSSAALEQNRNVSRRIGNALLANRNKGCCDRRFVRLREAWIDADYTYAEIDAPSEMEAKIKGVTGGFDLAANPYHRFGIFGAYRQGDYDLSGKGKLTSVTGSDLDINSYLAGLYYRYGRHRWNVLATVFGGKQDIDMTTDDRIVKADTSALQYGASLDISRQFFLPYAWIIEPSLGLYYTALDIDGFDDNVGKSVEFDVMHYMEAELGLRLEHLFCRDGWTTKVYVKPSVIQTFASGDTTRITGVDAQNTYKNQLLGRMEIGAKFGLTPALSAYTSANYTFGSDYKAYGVDAGLTYSW